MKKEEQKKLMDLDEGLLRDDEPSFAKEPIVHEFTQDDESDVEPDFAPHPELDDISKLMKDSAVELQQDTSTSDVYDSEFPHLTKQMIEDLHAMTKEAIQALSADGDIHEHERPVQHNVGFTVKENMEDFKSRVINKGFVITKGEAEYDLVVLHISMIDEEKLIHQVLYLANQANEFHGEYRGWQSKVSA